MKNFLLIVSFFIFLNCYAQKQANIWYFGENAGIDFNFSPPQALTDGELNTLEGCSSFADANGDLLFYSDGITVYDKNHDIMNYTDGSPGSNLLGNPSATRKSLMRHGTS